MYKNYEVLRDKAGLTDFAVAQATGIPPQTISAWKNNLYTPKTDKLLKIARFFGVSIEDLIEEKEKSNV